MCAVRMSPAQYVFAGIGCHPPGTMGIVVSRPREPDRHMGEHPSRKGTQRAQYPVRVPASTRTRYAKSGGVDIAYQVLGEGPIDLLLFTGLLIPIDCMDEEPSMARFQRRLATFGRLIRFDQRGVGLSDRGSPSAAPTGEHWVQDALSVLDAAGSERSVVLAPFLATAEGIALTAMYPERVAALVIVNGAARLMSSPDYPYGVTRRISPP